MEIVLILLSIVAIVYAITKKIEVEKLTLEKLDLLNEINSWDITVKNRNESISNLENELRKTKTSESLTKVALEQTLEAHKKQSKELIDLKNELDKINNTKAENIIISDKDIKGETPKTIKRKYTKRNK